MVCTECIIETQEYKMIRTVQKYIKCVNCQPSLDPKPILMRTALKHSAHLVATSVVLWYRCPSWEVLVLHPTQSYQWLKNWNSRHCPARYLTPQGRNLGWLAWCQDKTACSIYNFCLSKVACCFSSPSALPARSLRFTICGEIVVYVTVFNPNIEVATLHLCGWCMLGVFLLPAFTRLGHACQDLLSLCDGMHVCSD